MRSDPSRRTRARWLCAGMLLGWLVSVGAHLIAHRFGDECVEFTLPREPAPRPVLPGGHDG